MVYTFEKAKEMIKGFSRNQVEMTKQANSRRGITKKSISEESKYIALILEAILQRKPTKEEIVSTADQY
jgi:hypothetical protein